MANPLDALGVSAAFIERFNNPDYKEKVCHKCGTKHTTTKTRPVCNDCYKTYYR